MRLFEMIGSRYGVADASATQALLPKWFEGRFGSRLLAAQRKLCGNLSVPPGFRLLHLGVSPCHGVADRFALPCRFSFTQEPATGIDGASRFDALPLPSDTFDLVVLHHALDFCAQPQRVLAEAARVIRPGGRIVLIGFNPYSLLGVGKWLLAPWHVAGVWRHNSLRRSRVSDWLVVLGFALNSVQDSLAPGIRSGGGAGRTARRWRSCLLWRPHSFYMVTGRKRAVPLQPLVDLPWLPRRLAGMGTALANAPAAVAPNRPVAQERSADAMCGRAS